MPYFLELNCTCCDCKGPLGVSSRFIAEAILAQHFEDNEISDIEAVEAGDLLKQLPEEPFIRFPLMLDPSLMTLHFPLWCPRCQSIKYTTISVKEIKELSTPVDNKN